MLFLLKIAAEIDNIQRNICVEFASQPAVHEIRRVAEIIFTILLRSSIYSRELERNAQKQESLSEKRMHEEFLESPSSSLMLCKNVIVETIMFFNNYTLEWEELQSMQQLRTGCQLYCFEPLLSEQEFVSANMKHQHNVKEENNEEWNLSELNNANSCANCTLHGLKLNTIPEVEFHIDWTQSVHRRLLRERVCATLPQQRSHAWRWLYVFEPFNDATEIHTNNNMHHNISCCKKVDTCYCNNSKSDRQQRQVLKRTENIANNVNCINTREEEWHLSEYNISLAELIMNTIRTNVQLSQPHGFSEKMYITFTTITKMHSKLVSLQALHNFGRLVQRKWRKLLEKQQQQQQHRLLRHSKIYNMNNNKYKLLEKLYSQHVNNFNLENVLEQIYHVNFDQLIYLMQSSEARDVGQVSYFAWTEFALQHPSVMEFLYWLSLLVNHEHNVRQPTRLQVNKSNTSNNAIADKITTKESQVEKIHTFIANNDAYERKPREKINTVNDGKMNRILHKNECIYHNDNTDDKMLDSALQDGVNFTPHQQRCAACREMAMMQLMWISAAEHERQERNISTT